MSRRRARRRSRRKNKKKNKNKNTYSETLIRNVCGISNGTVSTPLVKVR